MSFFNCFASSWITIYKIEGKLLVSSFLTACKGSIILTTSKRLVQAKLGDKLCVINNGKNANKELEKKHHVSTGLRINHLEAKKWTEILCRVLEESFYMLQHKIHNISLFLSAKNANIDITYKAPIIIESKLHNVPLQAFNNLLPFLKYITMLR